MQRKIYEVQGMKFRLRPTSRRWVRELERRMNEYDTKIKELPLEEQPDEFEENLELFRIVTEPVSVDDQYEKIDLDDFDIKIAEQAFVDFLPRLTTTFSVLTQFLRS